MRKYRIKEVTNALGEKVYIPQYKDFLFWNQWYTYKSYRMFTTATLLQFNYSCKATDIINQDRREQKQKVVVSKKYIYKDEDGDRL